MGQTLRRVVVRGWAGWRTSARALAFALTAASASRVGAQVTAVADSSIVVAGGVRLDQGRFTVVADKRDARLAQSIIAAAQQHDSFPGLARPTARVLIAIAPDAQRFREWVGPSAPEWGAAIAIPSLNRVVMQGGRSGSDAGDPLVVLRHELAHLALHEAMGELPPRWFDEGYASVSAGEWSRESAFETSFTLAWRTMPGIDALDAGFFAGASRAEWTYAMSHRAVAELQGIDAERGLANFFRYWRDSRSFEIALRQAYGMTSDSFDTFWHKQTRRRYGALAFVANLSLLGGVFGLVLGPLWFYRRRRDRRRLDAMRAADAAQEAAARASALAAMLALEGEAPTRLDDR